MTGYGNGDGSYGRRQKTNRNDVFKMYELEHEGLPASQQHPHAIGPTEPLPPRNAVRYNKPPVIQNVLHMPGDEAVAI